MKLMKKIIFIVIAIICIYILTACDSRTKLSKIKCNEIYNYITEHFNVYEANEYLFYDYSNELLLINKSGDFYCNKDLFFLKHMTIINILMIYNTLLIILIH